MAWAEVMAAFGALRADLPEGELGARWRAFETAAGRDPPPFHLRLLLREIDRYRGDRPPGAIAVLDHGCGGGLSVLYLRALGFRAFGVNLGESARYAPVNALLGAKVLQAYDGRRLPFADASIDVVFSQQVLEHVADDLIEAYYAEEGRVLKPGGIAVHQVPHRLVPFDSHTKTWFVHWLPAPLRDALYRRLGERAARVHLRYRTPWFHRAAARRHIGAYRDLTLDRLALTRDFDSGAGPAYDGSVALRRLIDRSVHAPVVGAVLARFVRPFVMIDSLSVRAPAGPGRDRPRA